MGEEKTRHNAASLLLVSPPFTVEALGRWFHKPDMLGGPFGGLLVFLPLLPPKFCVAAFTVGLR